MSEVLEGLLDPGEASQIVRRVRELVERNREAQFGLVRFTHWTAVPQESSSHLSLSGQVRLANAFRSQGNEWVYAVALEDLRNITPVYKVAATQPGLASFNKQCAQFNYVLCPPNFSCLVICSTDDYLVVAGPPSFVTVALGISESEALDLFRDYVDDPGWSTNMHQLLASVLSGLREEYSRSAQGSFVRFPK